MTVGHLVHFYIHCHCVCIEIWLVALGIQSEHEITQDAGAKVVVDLSQIDSLTQAIANAFKMGQVGLYLFSGHLFINTESAAPRHSHRHRLEAVVVAGNATRFSREVGICTLKQWKTALDCSLN